MELDQKQIEEYCEKNHITCMSLFGWVLTPNFNLSSDIDFLVKFEPDYIPSLFGIAKWRVS